MAMNHSQKKRLENVWEALKHDKIAIFSIIFLALILILSLLAPGMIDGEISTKYKEV